MQDYHTGFTQRFDNSPSRTTAHQHHKQGGFSLKMLRLYPLLLLLLLVCSPSNGIAEMLSGPESLLGLLPHQSVSESSITDTNNSLTVYSRESAYLSGDPDENQFNSGFFATRRNGSAFLHMSLQMVDDDAHGALGATLQNINVFAHYGKSEGSIGERQSLSGLAPNFFHGSVSYSYDYTGATMAYSVLNDLTIHGGALFIAAPDLDDRDVYFGGFSYKNFTNTVTSVSRGGEMVGRSISLGLNFDGVELGYQHIASESDSNWQELNVGYSDSSENGTFVLGLGHGTNELYDDVSETRLTLSWSIPLGGVDGFMKMPIRSAAAGLNEAVGRSSGMFRSGTMAGMRAVGTGLALSSGDKRIDRAPRFAKQDDAGFFVLSVWNPISVRENREYGSTIYQNRDGTYAPSTKVIKGTVDSIAFNPYDLVPAGTRATADWHTHGADIPGYLSEVFSREDLEFSRYFYLDGYLGTPKGRMFLFDVEKNRVYQIRDEKGNQFILPH